MLCLLLAINWHNTFRHTHFGLVGGNDDLVWVQVEPPQHAHTHTDRHHHRHEEKMSFLNWLHGLLGDFEHTDFGDSHFELFLNSNNYFSLKHLAKITYYPAVFLLLHYSTSEPTEFEKKDVPKEVLSFSDPPFLASFTSRGPPAVS